MVSPAAREVADTTLDMPLEDYLAVAEKAGFELVLRTPFARVQTLQVRGRQEILGEVRETLCILGRRDGFLLVLESFTGSSGTPLLNMAELHYRFRQGPHHETAAEFETYKIPFPDPLAENERIYHAVVAGLGGAAPLDDGAMCVSAMQDVRLDLLEIMSRKDAYVALPEDRRARIGDFLAEWPQGFLHTYGFTLARTCEADVARYPDAPRRMAESRRITEERLHLLPAWVRTMIGWNDDSSQRAA